MIEAIAISSPICPHVRPKPSPTRSPAGVRARAAASCSERPRARAACSTTPAGVSNVTSRAAPSSARNAWMRRNRIPPTTRAEREQKQQQDEHGRPCSGGAAGLSRTIAGHGAHAQCTMHNAQWRAPRTAGGGRGRHRTAGGRTRERLRASERRPNFSSSARASGLVFRRPATGVRLQPGDGGCGTAMRLTTTEQADDPRRRIDDVGEVRTGRQHCPRRAARDGRRGLPRDRPPARRSDCRAARLGSASARDARRVAERGA